MSNLYYRVNVRYPIGVRRFLGDAQGVLLTQTNPWIQIDSETLKEFKRANKIALQKGLIIPTDEPSSDIETPNAISDTEAAEMVKNFPQLKKRLAEIDSDATLFKLLGTAEEQQRSPKVIALIKARIEEVTDEEVPDKREMF